MTEKREEPAADGEAGSESETSAALPVEELSFEQALAELERIVEELDQGEVDLEQSIAAYERGTRLRQHCERKLKEAQLRVEQIQRNADGSVSAEPVDQE